MKPRDIFGVIVRAVGLCCIGYGLPYATSFLYALGRRNTVNGDAGMDFFVFAVLYAAVGLILMRQAERVVEFAYPSESKEMNEPESDDWP